MVCFFRKVLTLVVLTLLDTVLLFNGLLNLGSKLDFYRNVQEEKYKASDLLLSKEYSKQS